MKDIPVSNDSISNDVEHLNFHTTLTPNDDESNFGEDVSVNSQSILPLSIVSNDIRTTGSDTTVRSIANKPVVGLTFN